MRVRLHLGARHRVRCDGQERAGGRISGPLGVLGLRGGGRGHGDAAGGSPKQGAACVRRRRGAQPRSRVRNAGSRSWALAAACAGVCAVTGTFKGEAFLPQLLPLHFAASATTLWLSAPAPGSEASLMRSRALAERVEGLLGAGIAISLPGGRFFCQKTAPGRSMDGRGRKAGCGG